jgi:hypothetical protein
MNGSIVINAVRDEAMCADPSPSHLDEAPRVSVVIPTFRRPDLLSRCLEAVCAQSLAPDAYEVIVADDGHSDETRTLVERFDARDGPAVRYVRPQGGRGPAVARNAGWRAARADLIAFTDDDTVPASDWLAAGERDLEPGWSALCGRVVVPRRIGSDGAALPPTDHELMTRGLESAEFVTANASCDAAPCLPSAASTSAFDGRGAKTRICSFGCGAKPVRSVAASTPSSSTRCVPRRGA